MVTAFYLLDVSPAVLVWTGVRYVFYSCEECLIIGSVLTLECFCIGEGFLSLNFLVYRFSSLLAMASCLAASCLAASCLAASLLRRVTWR